MSRTNEDLLNELESKVTSILRSTIRSNSLKVLGLEGYATNADSIKRNPCATNVPHHIDLILGDNNKIDGAVREWVASFIVGNKSIDKIIKQETKKLVADAAKRVEHAAWKWNDRRVDSRIDSYSRIAKQLGRQHAQEDASAIREALLALREKK